MARATVRRWTRAAVPNPWEYHVTTTRGMFRGHVPTWQQAFDRALQIIADQT